MLSEKSRKLLKQKPPEEQRQIVASWIPQAFSHHMGRRRFGGPPTPKQQADQQAELDRFFNNLPKQEQEFLLNLSAGRMQEELQNRYFGVPSRPFDPRGGRRGPPGPPRGAPRRPGRESQSDRRSGPPEWGPPRRQARPP